MPGRQSPETYPQRPKSRSSAASATASISVTLPIHQALNRKFQHEGIRGVSPGRQPKFKDPGQGTIPPHVTPTNTMRTHDDQEVKRIIATRTIERAWLSYRDRQMFKLLKHAVCAAENSLSHEILRKVSPKEADLFKDKSMRGRVRFRFGGKEYPPMIYFKVYTSSSNGVQTSIKYVSGKRMIQPASEAARDACDLMGNKKFYEQMIHDVIQQERYGITSEVDVTTLKDYMQYLSLLDETPAYLGGKDNSWRKLTLEVLPRQTVFYDIVDFLYGQQMSPMLQQQLPTLLSRPITQDVQIQHIKIISQTRDPNVPLNTPRSLKTESRSSRRSKQARQRAVKMKKLYDSEKQGTATDDPNLFKEATFESGGTRGTRGTHVRISRQPDIMYSDDDEIWDDEADKLYEWTQELSFEDIAATPRVGTGA